MDRFAGLCLIQPRCYGGTQTPIKNSQTPWLLVGQCLIASQYWRRHWKGTPTYDRLYEEAAWTLADTFNMVMSTLMIVAAFVEIQRRRMGICIVVAASISKTWQHPYGAVHMHVHS